MLWRVGDGKKIWIYDDYWIPGSNSARTISPSYFLEEATVDCLIDYDLGGWNSHVIDQHILPSEAQIIKAIPICVLANQIILVGPEANIRDLWELVFGWIRKDFPNIYTFSDHVNLLGIIIKM
ncbi:hypothetical protein CMV_001085 [Castanea mollissima]|uniref:Uncharacterized protein n=1 Tax=Castanea mollissima TaxID=60419 RepID=A0A8J4VYA3_9ROSI|nr:hypothetical protein CMV_001085 [Castanea mollissima]